MGSKDKGNKNTKKAPAKSLKEKRLEKKAKQTTTASKSNQSIDKAFDR